MNCFWHCSSEVQGRTQLLTTARVVVHLRGPQHSTPSRSLYSCPARLQVAEEPPGTSFFRVWSTCRVSPVPSGPVPRPLPRSLANATMWPWPFEVRPGEFAIAGGEQVNHFGCDWDDARLAACDAGVFIIIFVQ